VIIGSRIIALAKRQSGIYVTGDKRAVRKQCEQAKLTLSTQSSATIDCEALAN
jgi:molecular chaperone DnaK (HSP70)